MTMQPTDYLTLAQNWLPTDDNRVLLTSRILEVHERTWTSPVDPSKTTPFVRVICPDWVNIIALTPDNEVVMVEQFRPGIEDITLEVPGGVVDPGESPRETCERELREETGYSGDPVQIIGKVSSNPAMLSNYTHLGLIRNVRIAGAQELDEHEEIGVRLVPLNQIDDLIRQGVVHHTIVVAAFQLLRTHLS